MRKALLVVLILSSALAWAQGGCTGQKPLNGVTTGGYLQALANQKVRVCSDTLNPCTTVPLFSDAALTQVLANPVTTDAAGNYQYCATPGNYNEQLTSSASVFAQVNNTPVTLSGSGSGDVSQAGTSTITGQLNAALAPRYLYANQSTYWRWQLARASASQIYTAGGGAATAPVHIMNAGDSISGFGWLVNIHAMGEYMPLNALGYGNFYSIHAGSYGSAVTYSQSAGCVDSRNDNTSAQNFGPGGSRVDCSGTWTISYAPAAQYRFDTFYIVYEQTPAGGSFSYTVDGGAPVTVNTAGTELLGITTVTIAGASQATTHTIALANVSGAVRLYGMGTSQRAQPGFILDFVQSGGSQLAQWVSFPAFTQQLLAYLNPGLLYVRLGANDGGTGAIPASTFGANLSSWLTAIAVPSTTATMVLSNTPRGTTIASPQTLNCTDDAATGALYEGYRTQMFNLSASLGFSIYDERRYWPGSTATYTTFATGCAAGMNTDNIHPSNTGSTYEAYGLAAAIFQGLETPSRELSQVRNQPFLMTPAATINAAQSNSNGTITDSGTGFKAVSNNAWDFFNASARFFRFGTNESGSINAITAYPTASQNTTFSAYRQGSTAARAYSLLVNSDASTSMDTNNGDFLFSTGTTEHARAMLNSGSAYFGLRADHFGTTTNCSSSGGTCAAASSGSVTIAAAATTVTVATTQVTANSQIIVTEDSSLGTKLSVTCNTTLGRTYAVTARTAATSFVITTSAAPTTNPACLSFTVIN